MTYTFKLSSRLAHLWAPVCAAALAVSACTDGDMSSMSPFDQLGNGGSPAAVSSRVSPKAAVIETSRTVKFSADSGMTWSSSGGKITSDGTFSSTISGSFLVVGRGKNRTDSAKVTVVNPNQRRLLTISPREVQLTVGQSAAFAASATLPNGTPTTLAETWSTTGGTVDKDGNYIAGDTPGTYAVIVSAPSDGLADTAVVTVTPVARHLAKLVLLPTVAATMMVGDVKKYDATAEYDDGSRAPVSFSASGGAIDSSGQFTAGPAAGTFEVSVHASDAAGEHVASVPVTIAAATSTALAVNLPGRSQEPADFVRFAELQPPSSTPFSASSVVSLGCNTGAIVGCWWRLGAGESIKDDPSAPVTSKVLELTFPAGLQPGYGEDQFGGWSQTSPRTQYRDIYESGSFKIPSNDFETQLVGVKLWGYWGVGAPEGTTNPVQLYMIMQGNGSNTAKMSSWNIWFGQQGADSRRLSQNLNLSKKIQANTWHQYQIRMHLNDIGARNGVLEVWLDDVKVIEYHDVTFRDAANPMGFFGRKWHPIWGGTGGTAKTRDDHLWVSNVYLSGIPL
jgi:hypothetical protein